MRLAGFQRAAFARTGGAGAASNTATYIVQTPSSSLPNAQALSTLPTGLLYNTTTTGVLQTATLGSGLSGTTTITNDVLTGKAGGQTFSGGVAASETLVVQSTTHATKGTVTVAASQLILSNAETNFLVATLVFDNASISGQKTIHFKANGTLHGGIRNDTGGNMIYFSKTGAHLWTTGGDYDTGTQRMEIAAAGAITFAPATNVVISTANTTASTAVLMFDNSQAGGNNVIHFRTQGTVRSGIRGDSANLILFCTTGGFHVLSIGDYGGSGVPRLVINAGTFVNSVGGVDPGSTATSYFDVAPYSTPSAGGVTIATLYTMRVRAQTFANSGASNTISGEAATVYIDGPPVFSGTWATGYSNTSLRVAAGITYLSGDLQIWDGSSAYVLYANVANQTMDVGVKTFTLALQNTTIASAAGATYNGILFPQGLFTTVTITGTTNITTATGFNVMDIGVVTYTDSSAVTISHAATVRIAGAPSAAGSVTITKGYALWIDAGLFRLDGKVNNGGGSAPTFGTIGGTGPTTAGQSGWQKYNSDGTDYFIPVWV